MAFRFALTRRFDWPVDARAPRDGRFEHVAFTATFLDMGHEALEALRRAADEGDARAGESAARFLREALVGWKDVLNADGAPLPFNADNRDRLLDVVYVRHALLAAYARAMTPVADMPGEARAKNFDAPSASL